MDDKQYFLYIVFGLNGLLSQACQFYQIHETSTSGNLNCQVILTVLEDQTVSQCQELACAVDANAVGFAYRIRGCKLYSCSTAERVEIRQPGESNTFYLLNQTGIAEPEDCRSDYILYYSIEDGFSVACQDYYFEVQPEASNRYNQQNVDLCHNIACAYNIDVFELNGTHCRFYNCVPAHLTPTELITKSTLLGSWNIYLKDQHYASFQTATAAATSTTTTSTARTTTPPSATTTTTTPPSSTTTTTTAGRSTVGISTAGKSTAPSTSNPLTSTEKDSTTNLPVSAKLNIAHESPGINLAGVISGVVLGGLAATVAVIFLICYRRRKRKSKIDRNVDKKEKEGPTQQIEEDHYDTIKTESEYDYIPDDIVSNSTKITPRVKQNPPAFGTNGEYMSLDHTRQSVVDYQLLRASESEKYLKLIGNSSVLGK